MKVNKENLEKRLSKLFSSETEEINGTYYRVVKSLYEEEILSGIGAKNVYPGRWMQLGICYVLYTSSSIEIALAEAIRVQKESFNQYILASLDISCDQIFNLTHAKHLQFLGIRRENLITSFDIHDYKNESITQFIGRIAFNSGIKGLIVPSAAYKNGENLVLFSKHTPIPNVKIIDKLQFQA